jgi:hypothetical protein
LTRVDAVNGGATWLDARRFGLLKTFAPDHDGAKRFARREGDQLACLRQRLNEAGTIRG